MANNKFDPLFEKMQKASLPEIVIRSFEYYYNQLIMGSTGQISETDIQIVERLPKLNELSPDYEKTGKANLSKSIIIKLNGGLGTSMGLSSAKSLLKIKNGLSFIDIIAMQALHSNIPLLLMNSFSTRADTIQALKKYPDLQKEIPLDFLQHKVPKIRVNGFGPIEWDFEPDLEWCPPGHGEIYTALVTSGLLEQLIEKGLEYAFISNSDNLGATLDLSILGYFVKQNLPFLMEVADRTAADKKGGHLARKNNGRLILREIAQCPANDLEEFQNIEKHKFFNTNNIWINLKSLKKLMDEKNNVLDLPMIRNKKNVDPRDIESPEVFQLETAMGSAISVFKGASALCVPRSRFAPVKTTMDLLVIKSDNYLLSEDYQIVPNPARKNNPTNVILDQNFYKLVDQMETRFPHGAPSLIECETLKIGGDVKFGKDVKIIGNVEIINNTTEQLVINDNSVITENSNLF